MEILIIYDLEMWTYNDLLCLIILLVSMGLRNWKKKAEEKKAWK